MKIIIINGPNLNRIKSRNSEHYGNISLEEISKILKSQFNEIEFKTTQTNNEGEIINLIHSAPLYFSGLIINPGGFSHTSIGIRDALEICNIPKVEVHFSNISDREHFRHISLTASKCDGYITGFKYLGYIAAVKLIYDLISLNK
jgi:3-dehydroquinate dehydratase-2